MSVKRAAVIYNPTKISRDRLQPVVLAYEKQFGWAPSHWYETGADDAGRGAAEAALQGAASVIVVAGGDGTVRTVAATIYESGTPLALVPVGTGNLLARNLGIPLNDVRGAIGAAFGNNTRAIDLAVADLENPHRQQHSEVFLVMAGIGLDAEMANNTSAVAKKYLGWLAYVTPIARSIITNRLFQVDYRIDGGHVRSSHAHTVIVGNCGTLTGNMLLLPSAVVDDGLLDVVMLRPRRRIGWAGIGTRLTLQGVGARTRFGRRIVQLAPDLKALAYAQGERFEARFETPHDVELDGDGLGSICRVRITLRSRALTICMPDTNEPPNQSNNIQGT